MHRLLTGRPPPISMNRKTNEIPSFDVSAVPVAACAVAVPWFQQVWASIINHGVDDACPIININS